MKDKFYNTDLEEQETIINIDYCTKTVKLYTSRKGVYERIYKKLGEPTQTYYIKKSISGCSWAIPFAERKKISTILSRPTLIGSLS